ncbi:MAG: hypothetical protein ACRD0A_18645 [Acidimicrobiales bacterium]
MTRWSSASRGRSRRGTPDGTVLVDTAQVIAEGDTLPPNNVDADAVVVRIAAPAPTTSTTALAGGPGSPGGRPASGGSVADTGLAVGRLVGLALGLIVVGGAVRRRAVRGR